MPNVISPNPNNLSGPWVLTYQDCIGDSMDYINYNTNYFTCQINALSATLSSLTTGYGGQVVFNNDVVIGPSNLSQNAAGNRLFFSEYGNNTDPMYIYRYNGTFNKAELRVNIGDDTGREPNNYSDTFVIGCYPAVAPGQTTSWKEWMRVGSDLTTVAGDLSAVGNVYGDNITTKRVFTDGGEGRIIYVDSLLGKDDGTADGTSAKPFATLANAAAFYAQQCDPRGMGPVFKLVAGTSGNPRVYKGGDFYFYPDHRLFSCVDGNYKDLANANINDYNAFDRWQPNTDWTMHIQGNPQDPTTVVIESFFTEARVLGSGFWNGRGLNITYPKGNIYLSGISLRYNANNIPGYKGGSQYYISKTDNYNHLGLIDCHYAAIDNCIFQGIYQNPNAQEPYYTPTANQASNYMYGVDFTNCRYARIRAIKVTGNLRYIARSNTSDLQFEAPGVITLENSPVFYAYFEVQSGGSIYNGLLAGTIYANQGYAGNYQLKFSGAAGPVVGNWKNHSIVNITDRGFRAGGALAGQAIWFPSAGALPDRQLPATTTTQNFYVDAYMTQLGVTNTVNYEYVDTGSTPGTGNPRAV